MTFPTVPQIRFRPVLSILFIAVLVLASSYCARHGEQTENVGLSSDEAYLIDTYVRIARARNLHGVNHLESERLFTALDSTTDTTRISNTIRGLNLDPDRWVLVFQSIERAMASDSSGRSSEEDR